MIWSDLFSATSCKAVVTHRCCSCCVAIPLVFLPIDTSAHRSLSFSTTFGITLLFLVPLWQYDAGGLWYHSSLLRTYTQIIMNWIEQQVYRWECRLSLWCPFRREQGVSGQPSSVMVEGIRVTLPSYEEAVYGSSGLQESSGPPPAPPPPLGPSECRVPIVLSEGTPRGAAGGQGPSRTRHHRDLDFCLPSTSSSSSSHHHAETVLVHQAPSCSSSSSAWAREHPGGACAAPLPLRRDSESSDQHSLLSVTSADEFSDGKKTLSLL